MRQGGRGGGEPNLVVMGDVSALSVCIFLFLLFLSQVYDTPSTLCPLRRSSQACFYFFWFPGKFLDVDVAFLPFTAASTARHTWVDIFLDDMVWYGIYGFLIPWRCFVISYQPPGTGTCQPPWSYHSLAVKVGV